MTAILPYSKIIQLNVCRVIAGIDGKGTKIDGKKNYRSKWSEKLRTLVDAYEQHEDSSEEENEEIVDNPDE